MLFFMKYGGIDFDNGYTKVCFDDHQGYFPSLVAFDFMQSTGYS